MLITLIIVSMFRKNEPPSLYKELIEAKDQLIEFKQGVIDEKKIDNDLLREKIRSGEDQDSILIASLLSNQVKIKSNDKKLQAVAPHVANLNKEQLRRELSSY